MSEPKPERITDAELHYFAQESRYANVTGAIADLIRLVAEVRRLRGLIDRGFPDGLDGASGPLHQGLRDEAEAIRAEQKCQTPATKCALTQPDPKA